MKIRPANACQGCRYGLGGSLALLLHPLLHLVNAVVAHGCHGPIPLLAQLLGIKARGRAEGSQEPIPVLLGAVALRESVEDLD